MNKKTFEVLAVAAAALAASVAGIPAAAAQNLTAYTTASVDGYGTNFALLGVSVRPDGRGWVPYANLQVYRLQYDSNPASVTVWQVSPGVGIGYRMADGAVEGKVSYGFRSEDAAVPFLDGDASGGGFSTSLQANYWGGPVSAQALGSYSWDNESVYSQFQATAPVLPLDRGEIRAGAEYTWQGTVNSSDPSSYRSQSFGPVVTWATGRNSNVSFGAGWRDSSGVGRESTWYARVSYVLFGVEL